ncbi:MAG: hypothetical protein U0231_19745 [Nitrospiraceae bacterium]
MQTQAHRLFESADRGSPVDPNALPALVSILAFTGDDARYDEFLRRFRRAATPQE